MGLLSQYLTNEGGLVGAAGRALQEVRGMAVGDDGRLVLSDQAGDDYLATPGGAGLDQATLINLLMEISQNPAYGSTTESTTDYTRQQVGDKRTNTQTSSLTEKGGDPRLPLGGMFEGAPYQPIPGIDRGPGADVYAAGAGMAPAAAGPRELPAFFTQGASKGGTPPRRETTERGGRRGDRSVGIRSDGEEIEEFQRQSPAERLLNIAAQQVGGRQGEANMAANAARLTAPRSAAQQADENRAAALRPPSGGVRWSQTQKRVAAPTNPASVWARIPRPAATPSRRPVAKRFGPAPRKPTGRVLGTKR
jgi:hypothetical protein